MRDVSKVVPILILQGFFCDNVDEWAVRLSEQRQQIGNSDNVAKDGNIPVD